MLVEMINFCKPKIEFEVQHNKTNKAILKQFMHKSMIYMKKRSKNEELGNCTSWEKELEAWIFEMGHFKVQQALLTSLKNLEN
jgi:hypothetical protein